MRAILLGVLLLAGCDGVVVFTVHNIPADATFIGISATWNGQTSQPEIYTPPPTGFHSDETLGFRFPSASSDVTVLITAFQDVGTQRCITYAYSTPTVISISSGRSDLEAPLELLDRRLWVCR